MQNTNTTNSTLELYKYNNGNTIVTIFVDGTKTRQFDSTPVPVFPESIDLKITNYCNMYNICKFCHEGSDVYGTHANLNKYEFLLNQLPDGAELAIGGGNPLSHPDLFDFLEKAKDNNIICNLTVNENHIKQYKKQLTTMITRQLIKGLGISVTQKRSNEVEHFCSITDNVVFHVIMGVHDIEILDYLSTFGYKVLILGYKKVRKGNTYYIDHEKLVDENIYQWYIGIPRYFDKLILSFDNLAISQLELKRWFMDESWNEFYMGDDGQFTMYIDAVKNKFCKSSTSFPRYDITDNIVEMFNKVRLEN